MIKAVIFDVGGVLLRTQDLAPREKWARRLGLDVWALAGQVFECPEAHEATVGLKTEEEVWLAAQRRFALSATELSEFRHDFFAGDRWDESLLAWVAKLRGKYRTAILSNAWDGARRFIESQPGVVKAFEHIVISAEEGLRKPQEEIYRRVVNRLNVIPREAIFLDDVLENVEAAHKLGLAAVQFKAHLNLPEVLASWGVAL